MPEWYVYDKKGRRRKAKPHEIPKMLIDHSDMSLEDGELILPERMVRKCVKKEKKKKKDS